MHYINVIYSFIQPFIYSFNHSFLKNISPSKTPPHLSKLASFPHKRVTELNLLANLFLRRLFDVTTLAYGRFGVLGATDAGEVSRLVALTAAS